MIGPLDLPLDLPRYVDGVWYHEGKQVRAFDTDTGRRGYVIRYADGSDNGFISDKELGWTVGRQPVAQGYLF